jgi:SNF2 family DNA or RNA helicase
MADDSILDLVSDEESGGAPVAHTPPGRLAGAQCPASPPRSAAKLHYPTLFRDDDATDQSVDSGKNDDDDDVVVVLQPARGAKGTPGKATLNGIRPIDLDESPPARQISPLAQSRDACGLGPVQDLISPESNNVKNVVVNTPGAGALHSQLRKDKAETSRIHDYPPISISIDDDDDDDDDELLCKSLSVRARAAATAPHAAHVQAPAPLLAILAPPCPPDAILEVFVSERSRNITVEASPPSVPALEFPSLGATIDCSENDYAELDDGVDMNQLVPDMNGGTSGIFATPLFESESSSGVPNISREAMISLLNVNNTNADASSEFETPPALTVPLMVHQKRALHWMIRREITTQPACHPNGGILADDQGFGKTLSAISLLLTNTPPADESGNRTPWGTLIVTPLSLVSQWEQELSDRIAEPYRPKVCIHHGPSRTKNPYDLVKYDVVLTTYSILVQEYPKHLKEQNVRRKKGALFKLKWFRVILDEAHAIKNRRSESFAAAFELKTDRRWALTGTPIQNSLDDIYSLFIFLRYIIVSSHSEWQQRWKRRMESRNAVERERVFKQFQMVLGVVLLRRAKHDKIDGRPVIELPHREVRVVELKFSKDELEVYRNMEKNAVTSLQKFAADGGIMANYMHVLLLLLRLRQVCSHPSLCQWSANAGYIFTDEELDAVDNAMQGDRGRYLALPESVRNRLLRELAPDSTIPQTCPVCMDVIDGDDGIVTLCGHIFCRSDYEEWTQTNSSCPSCRGEIDDAVLCTIELSYMRKEVHALHRQQKRKEAPIVFHQKPVIANSRKIELVGFDLGGDAARPNKKQRLEGTSDACNEILPSEKNEVWDSDAEESDVSSPKKRFVQSAKIKALMHELERMVKDGDDKALVFSQWTRMLDLISVPLIEQGIRFERLDGSMDSQARTAAITEFKKRSDIRVFLISLKAGGFGLNLTAANRVMMMDCWW